jgi:hypothetical protein
LISSLSIAVEFERTAALSAKIVTLMDKVFEENASESELSDTAAKVDLLLQGDNTYKN